MTRSSTRSSRVTWAISKISPTITSTRCEALRARWAEVKRVDRYTLTTPTPTTPLAAAAHEGDSYRLHLEFLPDPLRDVLLISYRLEGAGNLKSPLDLHMHEAAIKFLDDDRIHSEWVMYEGGKKKDVKSFDLTRKKS